MTGNLPRSDNSAISRRVYLAAPVQARSCVGLSYEWFARAIENAGGAVVNAEVAAPFPDELEHRFAAPLIFEDNTEKLRSADILIAECSNPSLGVGYEIAVAEHRQMPIICFWRAGASSLSKMILGSSYPRLRVYEYSTEEDVRQLIRLGFESLGIKKSHDQCQSNRWKTLLNHFNVLAPNYDASADWRRADALISWFQCRLPSSGTVVDVGSGTGAIVSTALPGVDIIRIDLSEAMLRQSDFGQSVVADAHALPLLAEMADTVTLRQVLHYTVEGTCLSEISRILRPGGRLLMAQIVAPDDRTRRWWLEVKRMVQPMRRAFYSEPHLYGLLTSAGFAPIERETLYLDRNEPWDRFFANTPAQLRPAIQDFLARTPSALRDILDLQLSESGIRYRQCWCLMACALSTSRVRQ